MVERPFLEIETETNSKKRRIKNENKSSFANGISPCTPGATVFNPSGANCLANVGPLNNQVKNYWDYVFKTRFGT